jgi:hypothetical protein
VSPQIRNRKKEESIAKVKTRKSAVRPPKAKKVTWQDVCLTCVKYDHPDHPPDCEHCRKHGITEDILCTLNRMDQEDDPHDFQCGAYQPKQLLQ